MQRTLNHLVFTIANVLITVLLFYLLLFAFFYINPAIMSGKLRFQNLALWKAVSVLILSFEWATLLYPVYSFNSWFLTENQGRGKFNLATIATSAVGTLSGLAILFWVILA